MLGLVLLVTGCPPTKQKKKQPKDMPVSVVVGPKCVIKIVDTENSGGLKLWKARPVKWKNESDKVIVADFNGEPLLAGRDWVRLNPGESVTTRVSSRMANGRYKFVIKCLKNRGKNDEEDEESEDEYEVDEPPPDIIDDDGGP
jgi:hypothetical protein